MERVSNTILSHSQDRSQTEMGPGYRNLPEMPAAVYLLLFQLPCPEWNIGDWEAVGRIQRCFFHDQPHHCLRAHGKVPELRDKIDDISWGIIFHHQQFSPAMMDMGPRSKRLNSTQDSVNLLMG